MFILYPLSEDTQPVNTHPVQVMSPLAINDPAGGTLGHLLSVYRPRPLNQIILWIWFVGGVIISSGMLGYGGYLAISKSAVFGPVPAVYWSSPWFAAGGIILLLCLVGILLGSSKKQPSVRLYVQGLCIEKRKKLVLTWDQIDGIASGAYSQSDLLRMTRTLCYKASIFPVKGRPVHLRSSSDGMKGIANLQELVKRVKEYLYPTMQSELTRMFRSGLPLFFGPVEISQEGIKLRRHIPLTGMYSVPWRNVKRITVLSGYFLVELEHQTTRARGLPAYRQPVTRIPNLELLLKIIDQGVGC